MCRYQRVETLLSAGNDTVPDTLRVDEYTSIYNIQWLLPKGEGKLQPLQLVVREGVSNMYFSNEVTLDYELAHIDRVITGQCVPRAPLLRARSEDAPLCMVSFAAAGCLYSGCCLCRAVCRGATNDYVLLTLEGTFFGESPTVHLYLRAGDTTPFLSTLVDGSQDYTLRNGSMYVNGTGERFGCGYVEDDRSIECAYFYGGQVRLLHSMVHKWNHFLA